MTQKQIEVCVNKKTKPEAVFLGNQHENNATSIKFVIDPALLRAGYFYYALLVSPDKSVQYAIGLADYTFEVSSAVTKYAGEWEMHLLIKDTEMVDGNVSEGLVFISNNIIGFVKENALDLEDMEEQPLPEGFQIIYDDLLEATAEANETYEKLIELNSTLGKLIGMLGLIDNWKVVQQLIKEGYGADVFPIGTQLRCSHSVYGEIIWDVVAHDYNLEEESEHSMTLLSHDCIVNSMQYDATEALYYAETELAAGTYYFSLLSGYDTNYGGGKNIQFTLSKSVPAGGVIMFPWAYNTQSTATKISTYSSRESTAALETVTVTEGTSGTNLGTTDGKTANMNHIHRVRYGSNNWKESAVRQFLNSNAEAGSVWTPQTKFDRPPSWASSTDGFMKGFDEDFLSVVGECNHLTKTNSVFEIDGNLSKLYTTKDRFYLASHSEIFGGSENNLADGTQFPYYNEATNTDRIKYNAETARYWWLRSPYPSGAYYVRFVPTDGSLSNFNASNSLGVAVACDIY